MISWLSPRLCFIVLTGASLIVQEIRYPPVPKFPIACGNVFDDYHPTLAQTLVERFFGLRRHMGFFQEFIMVYKN